MSADMLAAALAYAERGWHVHPVGRGEDRKEPLTPRGQHDATTDRATIESWWSLNPTANVGIHCRPSGLYVLDVDVKPGQGGGETYTALAEKYGHTYTYAVRTHSGGWHYYYSVPTDCALPNSKGTQTSGLGQGVDTRGPGYVVAPPSVTPHGRYEVVSGGDPAPLPGWVAELLAPAPARVPSLASAPSLTLPGDAFSLPGRPFTREQALKFVGPALDRVRSTPQGQGFNDALFRAAAAFPQFMPGIWSEQEVWQMLDAAVRQQFPGGIDAEDHRTILSGFTAGANDPKAVLHEPLAGPWGDFPVPEIDASVIDLAAKEEAAAAETRSFDLASHLALAEKFAARFAGELRYVHKVGWHRWTGTHWAEDERDSVTWLYYWFMHERLAVAERLSLDAATAHVADALDRQVRGNCTLAAVMGVTRLARALPPLSTAVSDCDREAALFNTPTGTFDLNGGELRPHNRNDMITKVAGAGPDPRVDGSIWEVFLARILPDEQVRGFVQRLIGSAMYGAQREHVLPIWHGVGANGKSVLMNVVAQLFGNYCVHLPADALLSHLHSPHPTILMPLRGARLAFASETEEGRRFNAALVKRLTGGDPITARRMRQDDVTWSPTHQLIMVTNYPPTVEATDQAMWRRVAVVPFDVVIPEHERDPFLTERLVMSLPAVAAWAWAGWLDYRQRGLATPDAVRARTEAFRSDSDALGRFIEERCQVSQMAKAPAADLYHAWHSWAIENGEEPGGVVEFSKMLESRGFARERKNGSWYRGLAIGPSAHSAFTP